MKKLFSLYTIAQAVILTAVLMMALGAKACDKFDRTIAALQAAPALINSFSNSSPEEKAKLTQYFTDAVSALRAYKASKTDGNWSAFLQAFENIARSHVSDPKGAERISAIVSLVRIILGIPDSGTAGARMARAVITAPPPDLNAIHDSDVKELERLMKPLAH